MWFRPDSTDTTQFIRAVWDFCQWLVLGPALGALGLLVFAIVIGTPVDGWMNAMSWGAAFGMMGGVIVTGARWMARWKT